MAVQQLTPSTVEMDLGPNEQLSTTAGSIKSNLLDDRPSEKKDGEEIEARPAVPPPSAGDFPDGGPAAWCVVVGVSHLTVSRPFSLFLTRVWLCRVHVPCSRRRLHFTWSAQSLIQMNLPDSDLLMRGECVHSRPFRQLPSWLTAKIGLPVLL